jgi:hypothetical protein
MRALVWWLKLKYFRLELLSFLALSQIKCGPLHIVGPEVRFVSSIWISRRAKLVEAARG